MADTASAVASDTIDTLAAMTADNTSTRSYLTSVRGEIADLKVQAEAALRSAAAAAGAATQAKNQAVVAKNNAVTAAANAASAKAELDGLKGQQVAYAADLEVQKKNEAGDLAEAQQESSRLQAILVERARQARIAEQKRVAALKAKLEAERQAKIRAAAARQARLTAERNAKIRAEAARQSRLKAERAARIRAERAKAAAAARAGRKYTPKPVPAVPRPTTPPPVPKPSNPPPVVVPVPTTPSNYLTYPAVGPTTSGFGMRWHPVLKKWMLHDGLDWGIACGTPVYAAAPGEIINAGLARERVGQPGRHRPRDAPQRRPRDDLQPPHLDREVQRHGAPRPAHRLLRHDRLLDRLPPALRRLRGRHARQPPQLAVTVRPVGPVGAVGSPRVPRPPTPLLRPARPSRQGIATRGTRTPGAAEQPAPRHTGETGSGSPAALG